MQNTNKKRRIIMYSLTVLLTVMASVGVVMAILAKNVESRANRFTFSDTDITLIEEKMDEETETNEQGETLPRYVYPGAVWTKDPKVVNNSGNNLYVFLEVKVPCPEVRYVDEHNDVQTGAKELLEYDIDTTCWTELEKYKRTEDGWNVYVYAYTKVLPPNETTEQPLFSKVTFSRDVLEGQPGVGEDVDMPITALAVQSDNLPEPDDVNVTVLEMAYQTYLSQVNGNG